MACPAPKRVLSIQSEVVHGYVGNTAVRFVLQRLGVEVLALPTVLFSNHPGHGGFRGRATAPEDLRALLEGLDERGFLDRIDAVLSGYLGIPEHADIVRDAVVLLKRKRPGTLYMLDPVFGDDSGPYARPGVAEAMGRDLLPLADIVTPNRFELATLAGRPVATETDAIAAARALDRPLVLATSVPCNDGRIGTAAVTASQAWIARTARIDNPPNGIGDLLAALFLADRLTGADLPTALGHSAGIIDRLIAASPASKDVRLVEAQAALAMGESLTVFPVLP
jgi:pyridoxine kinase